MQCWWFASHCAIEACSSGRFIGPKVQCLSLKFIRFCVFENVQSLLLRRSALQNYEQCAAPVLIVLRAE